MKLQLRVDASSLLHFCFGPVVILLSCRSAGEADTSPVSSSCHRKRESAGDNLSPREISVPEIKNRSLSENMSVKLQLSLSLSPAGRPLSHILHPALGDQPCKTQPLTPPHPPPSPGEPVTWMNNGSALPSPAHCDTAECISKAGDQKTSWKLIINAQTFDLRASTHTCRKEEGGRHLMSDCPMVRSSLIAAAFTLQKVKLASRVHSR